MSNDPEDKIISRFRFGNTYGGVRSMQQALRGWYDSEYLDTRGIFSLRMEFFENYFWPEISHYFEGLESLIDVGCGNGRHANFFSQHVSEVRAFDPLLNINPLFVKANPNIHFSRDSLRSFKEKTENDKKYDVAFVSETFGLFSGSPHHADGDMTCLEALGVIHSLLSESGILVLIDMSNRRLPDNTDEKALLQSHPGYPPKYNLAKLCIKSGFEVIKDMAGHRRHTLTVLKKISEE
tara:strand:+ start:34 stop:744 length:711 start_codon:yes stop_codon:yes gene_type:complete